MSPFAAPNFADALVHIEKCLGFVLFRRTLHVVLMIPNSENGVTVIKAGTARQKYRAREAQRKREKRAARRAQTPRKVRTPSPPPTTWTWRGKARSL